MKPSLISLVLAASALPAALGCGQEAPLPSDPSFPPPEYGRPGPAAPILPVTSTPSTPSDEQPSSYASALLNVLSHLPEDVRASHYSITPLDEAAKTAKLPDPGLEGFEAALRPEEASPLIYLIYAEGAGKAEVHAAYAFSTERNGPRHLEMEFSDDRKDGALDSVRINTLQGEVSLRREGPSSLSSGAIPLTEEQASAAFSCLQGIYTDIRSAFTERIRKLGKEE